MPGIAPPEEAIGVNALHEPSGAGEFPVLTSKATLVPAGVWAIQLSAPQSAGPPASSTREVKVPDASYGDIRM